VRAHLRPVDIYAYLRARFGHPNGLQNFLRKDDSDNLVHWDFNLKCDTADIYIAGHSREILFVLSESLTDELWRSLILGVKADFARVSQAKGEMTHSFEKFLVFQNKFVALADYCADLHARILDAPPYVPYYPSGRTKQAVRANLRRGNAPANARRRCMKPASHWPCSRPSWRKHS
jgi:hypothetical protein